MARTKKPLSQEKPKVAVHTVTLAPDVVEAIQQLSWDASDAIGKTISGSAILRALVRQVVLRGSWATEALFLEVEKELKLGVLWGKNGDHTKPWPGAHGIRFEPRMCIQRSAPRAGQRLVGGVASRWRPPARSLRGRDRRG